MEPKDIAHHISDLLLTTGLITEEEINLKQDDSNPLFYSFHTKNGRELIGRNGETLTALTYLLKRFIEKERGEEVAKAFTLDINDFHKKRIDQLKTTAHMLAERARFFKSEVALDPMTPFERRVIHEYLQNYSDISTESAGVGKDRHVVIKFIKKNSDEFDGKI